MLNKLLISTLISKDYLTQWTKVDQQGYSSSNQHTIHNQTLQTTITKMVSHQVLEGTFLLVHISHHINLLPLAINQCLLQCNSIKDYHLKLLKECHLHTNHKDKILLMANPWCLHHFNHHLLGKEMTTMLINSHLQFNLQQVVQELMTLSQD